jgi:hypothetical protein
MLQSQSRKWLHSLKYLVFFSWNEVWCLKIGHDLFISHAFRFTIYRTSSNWRCIICGVGKTLLSEKPISFENDACRDNVKFRFTIKPSELRGRTSVRRHHSTLGWGLSSWHDALPWACPALSEDVTSMFSLMQLSARKWSKVLHQKKLPSLWPVWSCKVYWPAKN